MPSPGAGVCLSALWLLFLAGLRGERLAGGLQEVSISDAGVQDAARFAVEAYNQANSSLQYYRPQRVVRAQRQVVAGLKYYLTVEVGKTVCQKNGAGLENGDINACALPPEPEQQKLLCEFQVWSRPWLNDTQLVYQDCSETHSI